MKRGGPTLCVPAHGFRSLLNTGCLDLQTPMARCLFKLFALPHSFLTGDTQHCIYVVCFCFYFAYFVPINAENNNKKRNNRCSLPLLDPSLFYYRPVNGGLGCRLDVSSVGLDQSVESWCLVTGRLYSTSPEVWLRSTMECPPPRPGNLTLMLR